MFGLVLKPEKLFGFSKPAVVPTQDIPQPQTRLPRVSIFSSPLSTNLLRSKKRRKFFFENPAHSTYDTAGKVFDLTLLPSFDIFLYHDGVEYIYIYAKI
jgi:hypothetical protein